MIVDDLSRLARNQLLLLRLKFLFAARQITLYAVSEGFSTADSSSDITMGILGLVNEYKLRETRDQTLRGQTDKARSGSYLGGVPYGYRVVPDGKQLPVKGHRIRHERYKLEIIPAEAAIVKELFERFATGTSMNELVRDLNQRNVPTRRLMREGW